MWLQCRMDVYSGEFHPFGPGRGGFEGVGWVEGQWLSRAIIDSGDCSGIVAVGLAMRSLHSFEWNSRCLTWWCCLVWIGRLRKSVGAINQCDIPRCGGDDDA